MDETQATLRQNLRTLPRGELILFFGTFLNKFGTFVLPFLAIYMTPLGFTTSQAGLAVGAYGIGTLGACLLTFVFGPSLGMVVVSANRPALWILCGVIGAIAARIISATPRLHRELAPCPAAPKVIRSLLDAP